MIPLMNQTARTTPMTPMTPTSARGRLPTSATSPGWPGSVPSLAGYARATTRLLQESMTRDCNGIEAPRNGI